jgi:transposase-like protein
MKTDLTAPHFTNEEAARAHYEAIRWPDGPVCFHCGSLNVVLMKGKTTRPGLYNCRDCRKPFSCTMGTIYERSHIPLHKWLLATHIMCASKKGVSAHQLWRMLGFGSYKTAWFMAHRIREAMKEPNPRGNPFGGRGGEVEIDETYIGQAAGIEPGGTPIRNMNRVMTLIDRRTGRARSMVVTDFRPANVKAIMEDNLVRSAIIVTDEGTHFKRPAKLFGGHKTTNHTKGEYVSRTDPSNHTNTVEGFFSIFKRGMRGVYQHCGSQHLHRYVAEFDFRYSNRIAVGVDDNMRAEKAVKGTVERRLTYRPLVSQRQTERVW